jgi:RNA binding exosome subunit
MNNIHNITVRVIEKDEQKIPDIIQKFNQLLPLDFKKEKISINHDTAKGFEDKTIHILTMDTTKTQHNKTLIKNIFNNLPDDYKTQIYHQIKSRLDDEGNFYIRLDKESLLDDKFELVDHGDCFHIRLKIAAYPSNQENLKKSTKQFLEKTGCKK